jgi:lipopolysaccharide transport system ATP-binding protein
MKKLAIKAEHISKQYRLGQIGTGTLSHDLNRFWHKLRGQPDPYLKIGEQNDRSKKGESEYVWSLKDINFEIEQGDAVGIIGRNGAGKSTLLKILSKVTQPTTGSIKVNGRIASLLEVGTGFHPEMTGRENIYMNGAILGMRKKEIDRKLDEIIDFSGVERYIDTPVKRYSSGMYVRLAFAVAAHLESEILIVDEVLAVGDAEFQKKCLGKMGEVSKGEGRTVLFVSHNMAAVSKLCKNSMMLANGEIDIIGETKRVIKNYQLKKEVLNKIEFTDNSFLKVLEARINDNEGSDISIFNNKLNINLIVEIFADSYCEIEMKFFDINDNILMFSSPGHNKNKDERRFLSKGVFEINENFTLPKEINSGILKMIIYITNPGYQVYTESKSYIELNIKGCEMYDGHTFFIENAGLLYLNSEKK